MKTSKEARRKNRLAATCGMAGTLLLLGCNSESAPLWQLVDPGGGGAAPAIYAVPDTSHLFVSSDVGGIRYSPDNGEQFRVVNEGLDFSNAASDNIQDLTGYRIGKTRHVVGSATAGLLYWRSIGENGLSPAWQQFFDARGPNRQGATSVGALTVDAAGQFLYAGIGNSNSIVLNRLARVDPALSGQIYYFQTATGKPDPSPPELAGTLSLGAICPDVDNGPYLHISDLAAVTVDGAEYLYVGTTEGLMIIREPRTGDADCRRLVVPGRNPYVLAVQAHASDSQDVVLLLNEGGLEQRDAKAGDKKSTLSKGGVFHTPSVLAASPEWENITPATAQNKGLGLLKRGRNRPEELVLAGDAQSSLGILYTADFSSDRWQTVLDRTFIGGSSGNQARDGWRRSKSSFRGVKEIALAENGKQIAAIYVSGFQGRLLTGRRVKDGFQFEQAYTRVETGGAETLYRDRGVPLMNPWRSFASPAKNGRAIFLYHDNLMFVSDDSGESFRRPVEQFGWGTDALFDQDSGRIFVAYSRGNHLESGRRQKAERGGILVGTKQATAWQELSPPVPATGPVESLAHIQGELCAGVYREGVFCTALGKNLSWRRMTPESLDVLHLLDVDDGGAVWLVAAKDRSREICRVVAQSPQCSELPANERDFERAWFDDGRLWLATSSGKTFSSVLGPALEWKRASAAVTDLRTMTIGTERIALIASGTDGVFASRTPQERSSWCQLSFDGLQGNRVITTIADPTGGKYVYVAAAGVGFYRASTDNLAAEISENCN